MEVLSLHLKSLNMSFSISPYTQNRRTELMPTNSAVIGMIAAALGYLKVEEADKIESLKNQVEVYAIDNKQHLEMMTDFQTVGGFSESDIDGSLGYAVNRPKSKGGLKTDAPGFPIIEKEYLMNADFNVYLKGDRKLLETISEALDHPIFPLYFGRKCCVPACKINDGFRDVDLNDRRIKICR